MLEILIVDDHPIFRRGLRDVIKELDTSWKIHEAGNAEESYEIIKNNNISLIFLDIELPAMSGIILYNEFRKRSFEGKVVFLTMYKNEEIFFKAIDTGAQGYLLKENSHLEIKQCVETVLDGKTFISYEMQSLFQSFSKYKTEQKQYRSLFDELTSTEAKTLLLVTDNKSCQEIADLFFISKKAVENYRSNICKKLQIPNGNNALLKWALQNKELVSTYLKFKDI
ncbi:MAG: response regulator transcription factor [Bacteroidetes bacterium]|nr:response regulator transcription factor [Bacteroidota bacterium]